MPLRLCTGHGIAKERIQRAFEIGKKWFQLSNEDKSRYKLDLTEYVGWKGERLLLNTDGVPLHSAQYTHLGRGSQSNAALFI